jgi:hypothetical protein
MITIERQILIDQTRRIAVDLPPGVPEGQADVIVIVNPISHAAATEPGTLWSHYGSLECSPHFNGDPVAIQRQLRDEWDDRLSS